MLRTAQAHSSYIVKLTWKSRHVNTELDREGEGRDASSIS